MSDPFGKPTEDMIDEAKYRVPDQSEDPNRPIGTYENGKLVAGSKNKCSTMGRCTALKEAEGPSGPMLVFSFVVTEGEFAGRDLDLYCSFSPKARFKVVETYGALGLPEKGPWPKSQPIGVYVVMNLQDEEYQGNWSAKLKGVAKHPKGAGYRGASELS